MKISRRSFIKMQAIVAAASAAGISLTATQLANAKADIDEDEDEEEIRWDKIPCRFCGTGCSVLAGTRGYRIVATPYAICYDKKCKVGGLRDYGVLNEYSGRFFWKYEFLKHTKK